ncbi:MAG: hypothetical protein KAS76_00435 [Thermoplasmatales archaeon]|nr:hypothetical protein [Thermoplasmatales archaeon]
MQKLIKQIESLKKSDVSSIVNQRILGFKNINKKSNDELFSEMCFCILTANFNAEKTIRIQNEIGECFFTDSKDELSKKLRDYGHRFPNTRAEYISESTKCKDKLNEIVKLHDKKALREWIVNNVKGLGYKEASLPYYEKILVIIDGNIDLINIGDLFSQYIDGEFKNKKLETFSFSPKTLKFEVAPITNIIQHNYKKNLFKIYMKLGRNVVVSGDHSIFTFNGEEIIPVEVRNLKVDDYITIPKKLPILNSLKEELNIVDEFIKRNIFSEIYLKSEEYCNYVRANYKSKIIRKNQYTQHFRSIIPLETIAGLPKKAYSNDILKKFKVKISFRRSPNTIKSIIKLDKDFFWIIGLFIAETSVTKNPIETTLGLDELERFKKLNNLISKIFGVKVKEYKPKHRNVYISKVHNLGFFYLIRDILKIKGIATTKKIPKIVFKASFENILSFLQGYWEGDGWKKSKSYFSVSTNSNNLAQDLLILLLMVEVNARFCVKKSKGYKSTKANTIDFSGIIQPYDIKNTSPINKTEVIPYVGKLLHDAHKQLNIKTKVNGRHTPLYNKIMRWKHINQPSREKIREVIAEIEKYGSCENLKKLKKILHSDLTFVKIKKIEKICYNKKYVYDLEIARKGKNFQNFVGGFGGVCLHNSHFLRNVGFDDYAIIDFHIIDILVDNKLIEKPKTLTKKKYLEIEDLLRKLAKETNLTLAELDLYLWYMETGKILK